MEEVKVVKYHKCGCEEKERQWVRMRLLMVNVLLISVLAVDYTDISQLPRTYTKKKKGVSEFPF